MAIAQKLAGYTLGKADLLRRAMGKKKKEILDKEYVRFADGMKDNGYSEAAIKTLWDILVPFSDYAFNRAHTAGYGVVSYWTAYLKANYPAEYMAAAAHLRPRRQGQVGALPRRVPADGHQGAAARRQRLRVRNFAPVGHDIRFGLRPSATSGRTSSTRSSRSRRRRAGFTDFSDFLRKVDAAVCNKKVVESLIKAGAFDSLGHTRKGLLPGARRRDRRGAGHQAGRGDRAVRPLRGSRTARSGLAGVFDVDVPAEEWDKQSAAAVEREMLGLYVSDHPLTGSSRRSRPRRTPRSRRSSRATSPRARRSPSAASWPG